MSIPIFFMLLPLLLLFMLPERAMSTTLSMTNNCPFPIWPGLLSGAGTAPLPTTGFLLNPGESRPIEVPPSWSGRLWGRTLCSTDPSTGRFSCASADCGSGAVDCSGSGADPPATLAEFTLNGSGGMDFFDVSLVDGYNLPLLIVPEGGEPEGRCAPTGCLVNVNGLCPSELRVVAAGEAVACRSACDAFGTPEYCCSGEYGGPSTCKPSIYSQLFKNACPRAYSYAYDDATSTFTCSAGTSYLITFCPSTTSLKSTGSGSGSGSGFSSGSSSGSSSGNNPQAVGLPLINDTMVFLQGGYSAGEMVEPMMPVVVLGDLISAVHSNHSEITPDLSLIYEPCHSQKSINRALISPRRGTQGKKGRRRREEKKERREETPPRPPPDSQNIQMSIERDLISAVHSNHSEITPDLSLIYEPCHSQKSINRALISPRRGTQGKKGRRRREEKKKRREETPPRPPPDSQSSSSSCPLLFLFASTESPFLLSLLPSKSLSKSPTH
ncbi:hypothetical protein M5K25_009861 [Dendrobium thyrsiflorum]|uniref:Thaumatin-like protein n=1 Tax=Dendrobium thyrsiflorum TaxID=117978 RepID=A0ABD0V6V3_DENTH